MSVPIGSADRQRNTWRTSFEVEVERSSCEFQIVRTSIGAYSVFLDGIPLNARLTIPGIYFSSQDVQLPDGSTVTVRALGPFGWSAKRNNAKLSRISRSPAAVATLIFCISIAALIGLFIFVSWSSTPEYRKSNPPVWAFLGSSDDGHRRWFINTQAVRRRVATAQVEVLVRAQTAASGESEKADISKEDESTTVELLTCDPKADLYSVVVNMKTFQGTPFPLALPPDSELYSGAMQNFSRTRITDETISALTWNAGCFLGFHRKNAALTESAPNQPPQSQALNTSNWGDSAGKIGGTKRVIPAREKKIRDYALTLIKNREHTVYVVPFGAPQPVRGKPNNYEPVPMFDQFGIKQPRPSQQEIEQAIGPPDFEVVSPEIHGIRTPEKWRGYFKTVYWCVPISGATTTTDDFDGDVEHPGWRTILKIRFDKVGRRGGGGLWEMRSIAIDLNEEDPLNGSLRENTY